MLDPALVNEGSRVVCIRRPTRSIADHGGVVSNVVLTAIAYQLSGQILDCFRMKHRFPAKPHNSEHSDTALLNGTRNVLNDGITCCPGHARRVVLLEAVITAKIAVHGWRDRK